MIEFDSFGPEKIFQVCNARLGLNSFVVIDNTALGVGKGGIRMTSTVSVEEVSKLARAMTWKNALAELPFGGAKAGIVFDSRKVSPKRKIEFVKEFSKALKSLCPSQYIAGPDINTSEIEMEIFAKANGSMKSCTGKPKKLGGLPHELGSTGFGVFHATKIALKFAGLNLNDSTVAIEGFGNVGVFAAKHLSNAGAKIVAVSDSHGLIFDKNGLDFEKLEKVKEKTGSVINYGSGKVLGNHEIVSLNVDVLIPAALPDLIVEHDVESVKAKLIVEGSNIPIKPSVEKLLHDNGILIVPDIIANSGGVISSYVETISGKESKMFKLVEKKISKNTELILKNAKKNNETPRDSALEIAKARVLKKCKTCGI